MESKLYPPLIASQAVKIQILDNRVTSRVATLNEGLYRCIIYSREIRRHIGFEQDCFEGIADINYRVFMIPEVSAVAGNNFGAKLAKRNIVYGRRVRSRFDNIDGIP